MFITDQSLAVYVIAPIKTNTSQLRSSHSTIVNKCSMERIEVKRWSHMFEQLKAYL